MKILATVIAVLFLIVFRSPAETTNILSDAEIQGRELVQQILEQVPVTNSTITGVLNIRDSKGDRTSYPLECQIVVSATDWQNSYEVVRTNELKTGESYPLKEKIIISHVLNQTNCYQHEIQTGDFFHQQKMASHILGTKETLSDLEIMKPFVESDFLVADLGLEFFHWPAQRLLKHEVRRSRGCAVLESTNPYSFNGYARVVSWIDSESLGIIHAEAFDSQNKLLKEFDPKSFKKVNGQWELQEMEIRNVQTGSRTRLEFDLKSQ